MRGYLTSIRKDSSFHMHGLPVCVKEGLPFCTRLISRKLWRLLLIFLTGFTSLCLTSLSSIDHLLGLCARFLILFHLT